MTHQLVLNYQKLNSIKIGRSGRFLVKLSVPLLNTGLPLIGNVLKALAKSVLISLGLPITASDEVIHKKIFGSGTTKLIILSKETNDIMKIVKSLEEFSLLIKRVSKTIKNKAKEQ